MVTDCTFDIDDENVLDYIVQDIPGIEEEILSIPTVCAQRADASWIIAHGPLSEDRQLNISSLGYFTIPKI